MAPRQDALQCWGMEGERAGGGGSFTTTPPCTAEEAAGRWLGIPEGWVQAVHQVGTMCTCAYVRVCVSCLWCVHVVHMHMGCTCVCWVSVSSCAHLFSAVMEEMHTGPADSGQGQRNSLFPWPSTVIKSPNFSLTIISSK